MQLRQEQQHAEQPQHRGDDRQGRLAAQDSASPEPCYEEDCYARSETSWPVVALWSAAALWLIVWLRKK